MFVNAAGRRYRPRGQERLALAVARRGRTSYCREVQAVIAGSLQRDPMTVMPRCRGLSGQSAPGSSEDRSRPESASPRSFGVRPGGLRSIPRPPFEKIELNVMLSVLLVAETRTPFDPLKAIVFDVTAHPSRWIRTRDARSACCTSPARATDSCR